jgi:hypothetical protein
MVPEQIHSAWRFFRRYGFRRLVRAAWGARHRLLPFHYRMSLRRRLNRRKYGPGAVTRPLAVVWVSPDAIEYNGPTFSNEKYIGAVRGGDWDTDVTAFDDERMYQGLRERFAAGRDWEDTQYYALAVEQFEANGEWLGYRSLDAFRAERLAYLDQLYADIADEGYKSQAELPGGKNDASRHGTSPSHARQWNEIACNVARDGELLLNNGIHRLSIAKILELETIPIQFVVRHTEWQRIRTAIAESDRPADTALEYGVEPTHPDLQRVVPRPTSPALLV